MFVIGVCAGPTEKFDNIAAVGIIEHGRDARLVVLRDQQSIAAAYNSVIDAAAPGEAVVLLHDDVRLLEPLDQLSEVFADPDIAVAGVVGGRGVTRLAWWKGGVIGEYRMRDAQGALVRLTGSPGRGLHDVDAVDGMFLALSPWAVTHLRFDETYPGFDGYDGDICAQARAAGKRVVTVPIAVSHETGAEPFRDGGFSFHRADLRWRSKWAGAPRWKRAVWATRSRFLRVEYRLRRR